MIDLWIDPTAKAVQGSIRNDFRVSCLENVIMPSKLFCWLLKAESFVC